MAPQVPIIETCLNVVKKTEALQKQIIHLASEGFSPSSLTNYIRNPIDFYYQKILKIKDHVDVEETVAANTLGTVVHNTLEDFYKPLVGSVLDIRMINDLKTKIQPTVLHHFRELYKDGDITQGSNLISFEVAKRYIFNFLEHEQACINNGDKIKIDTSNGNYMERVKE